MEDVTPITLLRAPPGRGSRKSSAHATQVFFDRDELMLILDLYGAMVAAGEWRDYAIGDDGETATFSVFRDSSGIPLYRIVKHDRPGPPDRAYSVLSASGQILRHGRSIGQALGVFDRRGLHLV